MVSENRNKYVPDLVYPPGETISELLDERGWSKADLATRLKRTSKNISDLVAGRAPISAETALNLERVFDIPASFWTNLEREYRLYLARSDEAESFAALEAWIDEFPIKEMVKLNWIQSYRDKVSQISELLRFFGVATVEAWQDLWARDRIKVAMRNSRSFTTNTFALAAWLRCGEQEAERIRCNDYSESKFRKLVHSLRSLTLEDDPQVFYPKLQEACADVGVVVVFVPEVPGTRACGAAWWHSPEKAVIQLSLRHKSDDHLWFAFFHESKHILDHQKKLIFISGDKLEADEDRFKLEHEANAFASDLLIPPQKLKSFLKLGRPTPKSIKVFAKSIGIAPGIVVGRLQHDKVIGYNIGNKLKNRYVFTIE